MLQSTAHYAPFYKLELSCLIKLSRIFIVMLISNLNYTFVTDFSNNIT